MSRNSFKARHVERKTRTKTTFAAIIMGSTFSFFPFIIPLIDHCSCFWFMELNLDYLRCVFGGFLMGLANLVPGISGGTMLLAAGVYPRFIRAVAELTSFRFKREDLLTVVAIAGSAVVAILFLAGSLKDLVLNHRWIMYSLFIGMTLGGLPLLNRLMESWHFKEYAMAGLGFLLMAFLCFAQAMYANSSQDAEVGFTMLMFAGVLGGSAMVLPGISGSFLLLLINCYIPILSAVDEIKQALKAHDLKVILDLGIGTALPVGVGVIVGVFAVSHLLRRALDKFATETYSLLFGVLLGAVLGLWPFQSPRNLEEVKIVKGQSVELVEGELFYSKVRRLVKKKDIPTESSLPSPMQGLLALALVAGGYSLTRAIDRFGPAKKLA